MDDKFGLIVFMIFFFLYITIDKKFSLPCWKKNQELNMQYYHLNLTAVDVTFILAASMTVLFLFLNFFILFDDLFLLIIKIS